MTSSPYAVADLLAALWGECPHCGEEVRRGEPCGCPKARRAAREQRRIERAEEAREEEGT